MTWWDVFLPDGKYAKRRRTYAQAKRDRRILRQYHVRAVIRPRITYRWVTGDKAGLKRALVRRLNAVGRELGRKVYVRDGLRTYAEQVQLYEAYMAGKGPLAAFPGTSNHGRGTAADCQLDARTGPNIGNLQAARRAMKRHGLCLPVPGETWHVEVGETWKA